MPSNQMRWPKPKKTIKYRLLVYFLPMVRPNCIVRTIKIIIVCCDRLVRMIWEKRNRNVVMERILRSALWHRCNSIFTTMNMNRDRSINLYSSIATFDRCKLQNFFLFPNVYLAFRVWRRRQMSSLNRLTLSFVLILFFIMITSSFRPI